MPDIDRLEKELESLRAEALRQMEGWRTEQQETKRQKTIITKLKNEVAHLEESLEEKEAHLEKARSSRRQLEHNVELLKEENAQLKSDLEQLRTQND